MYWGNVKDYFCFYEIYKEILRGKGIMYAREGERKYGKFEKLVNLDVGCLEVFCIIFEILKCFVSLELFWIKKLKKM